MLPAIDIASTKAYSLGRRSHYRDYVDLYFIIKSGISIDRIIKNTQEIYKETFNPKLFLAQLTYFDDIKREEIGAITFTKGNYIDFESLKKFLLKIVAEETKKFIGK